MRKKVVSNYWKKESLTCFKDNESAVLKKKKKKLHKIYIYRLGVGRMQLLTMSTRQPSILPTTTDADSLKKKKKRVKKEESEFF